MKKLLTVLFLLFVIVAGIVFWWKNGQRPVNATNKTTTIFVIKKGENLRDVGYNLKKEGLIRDPIVFFLLIKQQNLDGKIQAGDFRLSPSMSTADIAQNLTHGTLDIWVTIPEGKRATEIAQLLEAKLPSYKANWKGTLIQQEGYLFPDTYLFPNDATIDTVMHVMRNNFEKKYQEAAMNTTTTLTKEQVVTLASIVQREANTPEDMALVASVFENRLAINMALGSDVTVEYALGYDPAEKTWWKKDLNDTDLAINSLYNTRANPGLPPGPICNPGSSALQAVLHAPTTKYMYFVADAHGKVHFATTLEQHNANVKKYL
jgi:peptidoglycan lytic transglycosylase G